MVKSIVIILCHLCLRIIIFSKKTSQTLIQSFIQEFQNISDILLFMGITEEREYLSRLANAERFHIRKYGFNLDSSPVTDVNTNLLNTIKPVLLADIFNL